MTIIQSTSHSPTFNLAAEEYLFAESQDEVLFLYVNEPSVIIGSNQAIQNEVDLDFCEGNNIQVVRRMSGGGAVYHDEGNLNFCFISNKRADKSSLSSDFLLPIVDVLTSMNIPVQMGMRKDLWLPDGTKISGTASHVGKIRELHHGTLLYDSSLDNLESALKSKVINKTVKAIASVHSEVKNIRSFLEEQGQFTIEAKDFFHLIAQKLLRQLNTGVLNDFSEQEILKIKTLEENKYISKEWTFRK